MSIKVVAAINDMNRRGHDAHLYKHDGKEWVEIDQCMLASFAEIEELVDGVHSFEELEELFKRGMHKNWADSNLSSPLDACLRSRAGLIVFSPGQLPNKTLSNC